MTASKSIVPCPVCGKVTAATAYRCPHCGFDRRKVRSKKGGFIALALAALSIVVAAIGGALQPSGAVSVHWLVIAGALGLVVSLLVVAICFTKPAA